MSIEAMIRPACAALLLACAAASSADAQAPADSGAFIVRLGTDTVAVERYVRRADTLRVTVVTRSPRTAVRQATFVFGPGEVVRAFGAAAEGATPELRPLAVAEGIPLSGQSYVPFQLAAQRAHRAGADSLALTLIAGQQSIPVVVRRAGPNIYTMPNQFGIPMRITVDEAGRIRALDAGGGSTVERVERLDVDALTTAFRARDEAGRGLGMLSPRDTARATVQGANITVDYGRPSLRGRPLEMLVPPGEVWRTGANLATHFTTSRDLMFGNVHVPAGTYTLFTLPRENGWQLIISRQTGQGGLDYDPAHDLARLDLVVDRNAPPTEQFTIDVDSNAQGGALRLRWGTVRASAPFRVMGS